VDRPLREDARKRDVREQTFAVRSDLLPEVIGVVVPLTEIGFLQQRVRVALSENIAVHIQLVAGSLLYLTAL
jgi:hypothetical protein